eukprot:987193-Amphidinium_carterae.2
MRGCYGFQVPGLLSPALRELLYSSLYSQLPKEGAKNAGERRLIAVLPQVYRHWSACCRADLMSWLGVSCARIEVSTCWTGFAGRDVRPCLPD